MGSSAVDGTAAGLVGRDQECAVIDGLIDAASRGESGSLVLRAEAGMGKTSLLGYAADRASGMTRLSVTGVEAESDLDFAGLHGLVRPIVEHLPRLPEPQREAVAAEARPILCLVDDAQWLDVPSADSLVFTARRLGAEGIVILFAAREDERPRFDARGLQELRVGGLDRESALVLLDRSVRELSVPVSERMLADAAGNPLALLELPACLSDAQLAGRASMPEAIPLSSRLKLSFRQQIERLPEPLPAALCRGLRARDEMLVAGARQDSVAVLGQTAGARQPEAAAGTAADVRQAAAF